MFKKIKLICSAIALCAIAAGAYFMFFGSSLVGSWEMVEIRATQERIEQLPAAQRATIERYFNERLEREKMQIEFFDDGTGLITLIIDDIIETNQFRYTAENGILNKRIGIISMDMEYTVSLTKLVIINHNEEDGIVREFRKVNLK